MREREQLAVKHHKNSLYGIIQLVHEMKREKIARSIHLIDDTETALSIGLERESALGRNILESIAKPRLELTFCSADCSCCWATTTADLSEISLEIFRWKGFRLLLEINFLGYISLDRGQSSEKSLSDKIDRGNFASFFRGMTPSCWDSWQRWWERDTWRHISRLLNIRVKTFLPLFSARSDGGEKKKKKNVCPCVCW